MNTWYDIIKQLNENFWNRKLKDNEPINKGVELVSENSYIISVREIVKNILVQFENLKYYGVDGTESDTDKIITNILEATHIKCFNDNTCNSNGVEVIKNSVKKIIDKTFLPKNVFELNEISEHLTNVLLALNAIIELYKANLKPSLKIMEDIVYESEDLSTLNDVSSSISRKLINKELHPEFEKLKEHSKVKIENLKTKYIVEKLNIHNSKQNTIHNEIKTFKTHLNPEQLKELHKQLIKTIKNLKISFINPSTNEENFLHVFGKSSKNGLNFKPVEWLRSKEALGELLTLISGYKNNKGEKCIPNNVRNYTIPALFKYKGKKELNKPSKPSSDIEDIKKIINTLQTK